MRERKANAICARASRVAGHGADVTRLAGGSAGPRDYAALGQGLRRLPKINQLLKNSFGPPSILREGSGHAGMNIPEEPALADLLERAIVESPPASLKNGGAIRPGYDAELDEVRSWVHEGKGRLLELEKQEREHTGIPSLKVGFNNVFGYFIEVTKTHLSKVPLPLCAQANHRQWRTLHHARAQGV